MVQFAFALEVLLGGDNSWSGSTSARLAERTAFILGDSYEERVQIEKFIREIYRDRSGVAHGGEKRVSWARVLEASRLLHRLIVRLATEEPFVRFTSVKQLDNWVLRQKYGHCEK
jgi:hypothetical protein